jgi:protocatechuate 3,4-dioxygenase beta subunit
MGNRLTLPLLLLAALLAGGAFFWMSDGERSGPERRVETAVAPTQPQPAPARLESPAPLPAEPRAEAVRAPATSGGDSPARASQKGPSQAAVAVTGRVVDRFGAPVPDARLLAATDIGFPLDLELERELPWLQVVRTTSDAQGRFRLEGLEPGTLQVSVRAGGFAPHDQRGLSLPTSGLELDAITLARGAVLSGMVVDPDGRPVAGARIVRDDVQDGTGLFFLGARRPSAVSAANGRFRVDELACGAWRFIVQSDDHPNLTVEGLAEEPGVEVAGLRWQLAPGATLSGTVTGIPSAERGQLEVRASRGSSSDAFLGFGAGRSAAVDAGGAFLVRGLTVGETYTLEARRAESEREFGFWQRSRSKAVQARAGDTGVILTYQPEAAVTLTVHDAKTRAPLERLEVETGIDWPAPLTDDDGNVRRFFPGGVVRVGGLRPSSDSERVQLAVKATGYREYQRADIAVRPGQELDLGAIFLDPVPLVRVRVRDQKSGQPIEGAQVRLSKEQEGHVELRRSISISEDEGHESIEFGDSRSARTDGEGWAELTSYEDSAVKITARAEGYAPATLANLVLPRGESTEHELRLTEGGAVHVQVLDAQGVPLAAAQVEHRMDGDGPQGGVFTLGAPRGPGEVADSEGRVLFANLAPGQHSFRLAEKGGGGASFATADHLVIAGLGGGSDEGWSSVQVLEGETSELVLRAAPSSTLVGRVREAGKVLAGATLRLEKDGEDSDLAGFRLPGMGGGPEGRSDGEGRYQIADVAAGSYKLVVEHPTRRMPAEYPLELREGENVFDIDLALAIIAGRVLDQEGKGIPGVRVWPERQASEGGRSVHMRMIMIDDGGEGSVLDSGQFGERALTDAEGRYTLRGVASDTELVIRAEGDTVQPGRSPSVRLAPNEIRDGVELRLDPAGSIRVEAKLSDGAPARFQLVQAEYLDDAEPKPEPKFSFMQQGATELSGLKPGRWKVNVRSAQGGPGQQDPGQDQEILVRPQETASASFEVD